MSATINKLMTTTVGKSAEFQYSDKSVTKLFIKETSMKNTLGQEFLKDKLKKIWLLIFGAKIPLFYKIPYLGHRTIFRANCSQNSQNWISDQELNFWPSVM